MTIFNHFKNLSLTEDQKTSLQELESFLNGDEQVFLLKGYAGTGKTTILKGLSEYLKEKQKPFSLMAPTGRAAKIMREKTGRGSTIHRGIYKFDRLEQKEESKDIADKKFHYYFPVDKPDQSNQIVVIDESSMISDTESQHELFTFGSGKLLTDILTYLNLNETNAKLILVGDPAQLPPVTDSESKALDSGFFRKKGFSAKEVNMTQPLRQEKNSAILSNANFFRDLLMKDKTVRNNLRLTNDENEVFKLETSKIVDSYLNHFPNPEVGNGVIITFSNASALSYNLAIRDKLFPENQGIQPGDIIVVNNNNYHTYGVEIFNGDMAKVIDVSDNLVNQTAPIYIKNGNKKIRKNLKLTYRDVVLKFPHIEGEVKCKIVDSLLNSPERDLTVNELRSQYINFVMRFNNHQQNKGEVDEKRIKENSEEFQIELKDDAYFNALRVKYGYALTCHKAQGGEWDKVFVDFTGRIGLDDDKLRWCYTAITRASEHLYMINPPKITSFDKLKFSKIVKVSKAPKDFYPQKRAYPTPYHSIDGQISKRLKYYEICEAIRDTPFNIESVDSKPYQEIYNFAYGEKQIRLDFYHAGSGIFNDIKPGQEDTPENQLKQIIKEAPVFNIDFSYEPSTEFLSDLYSRISMAADESGCDIINVVEYIPKNYVMYYFKTSGKFSLIQFYFRKNGSFSTAMPKSDLGHEDEKLKLLINKLS